MPVWTGKRHQLASEYKTHLSEINNIQLPINNINVEHAWHLFVIRTKKRDELKSYLSECNIETVINYPKALPFVQAYEYLGAKPANFPVAWTHQSEILSLPIFPDMTFEMVKYVSTKILEFSA